MAGDRPSPAPGSLPRSESGSAEQRLRELEAENAALRDALAQSERHGRLILEATAEGILVLDAEARCEYANPSAFRILRGSAADEVVGRSIHGLVHHSRPDGSPLEEEESEIVAAVRRGEPLRSDDVVLWRLDGTPFHAECWSRPLVSGGRNAGAVLTMIDITDRREAEEAARRTAVFRDQILGVVGHDLRNPLGAIVMSTALLQKRGGLTGWQAKTVDRIRSSAARMGRIINDLLSYTRTRLGTGIPIECRPAALDEICNRVIDELRAAHPDQTIVCRSSGDSSGEWDPDRLEQVVSNLVSNAIDHGDPDAPIEVTLESGGALIQLTVKNFGDPFPPEVLAHAFEPFHRGPEEKSRKSSGLGLGLFIAREIVRGHGGEIAIHSLERGTLLSVSLPRHGGRAAVSTP